MSWATENATRPTGGAARAALRLPWAMSVIGAEHLSKILGPRRDLSPSEAEAHLWVSQGLGPRAKALTLAVDEAQESWAAALGAGLRGAPLHRTLASRAAGAATLAAIGRQGAAARREWRNKFMVCKWVTVDPPAAHLPDAGPIRLEPLVEHTLRLPARKALWALEALGQELGRRGLIADRDPPSLRGLEDLSATAGPLLHAGLGLALAEEAFRQLEPTTTPKELDPILQGFLDRCREASDPRFLDFALEPLGLVARCFFRLWVDPVAARLEALGDPAAVATFWHGVGRGSYFAPLGFLPGHTTVDDALARLRQEHPEEAAREHQLAGLGFAYALVNLSHPGVFEAFLERRRRPVEPAFAEGFAAAVAMRQAITPQARIVDRLIAYRPAPALRDPWQELVLRSELSDRYRSLRKDPPRESTNPAPKEAGLGEVEPLIHSQGEEP